MDDVSGRRFTILRTLGRGGFGEVYQAEMVSPSGLSSTVAVKVLHTGLDPRSQAVQRLQDEGRILSVLRHPGIVGVHDLAVLDGRVALVTEFVEGADLPDCVRGADPMPPGAVCEAMAVVAGALHAAHQATGTSGEQLGLLHRDVKPGNIRVGRHGEVKLLDFGIATASGIERSANTQTNALIGSFPYMAPERFRKGVQAGPASDFYSLGCTLYEALAGRKLYDAEEMAEIVAGKASREAADAHVSEALAALDAAPAARALLTELLAFDPERRPDGPTIIARLEDLATDIGGVRLSRWARHHEWSEPSDGDDAPGPLSGQVLVDDGGAVQASETSYVEALNVPPPSPSSDPPEPRPAGPVDPPSRGWGRLLGLLALPVVGLVVMVVLGLGGAGLALLVVGGETPASVAGDPEPSDVDPEPSAPVPDGPETPDAPEPTPVDGPGPASPEPGTSSGEPSPRRPRPDGTQPAGVPVGSGAAVAPVDGDGSPSGRVQLDVSDCGAQATLEQKAGSGSLSGSQRTCLRGLMQRADGRMVDRQHAGALVLADAQQRCRSGSCADYERDQTYYFEELGRSDPDMMYAWALHMDAKGRDAETRLWARRALERRSVWKDSSHIRKVEGLYALDAKAAYRLWQARPNDEQRKLEARDAAVQWAQYRSQVGKDPEPAMELCRSAAGRAEVCNARVNDLATRVEVVFVSIPGGASVKVDGKRIGATPVKMDLTYGTHSVEVESEQSVGTREIDVGVGKPTRWTYDAAGGEWTSAL